MKTIKDNFQAAMLQTFAGMLRIPMAEIAVIVGKAAEVFGIEDSAEIRRVVLQVYGRACVFPEPEYCAVCKETRQEHYRENGIDYCRYPLNSSPGGNTFQPMPK